MKLFKVFFVITLGCGLLTAQLAIADVVGRITGINITNSEIEIDGIRYALPAGVKEKSTGISKNTQELTVGLIVQFNNSGATITQIRRFDKPVDMIPLPRPTR